ncbi:MAG: 1-acyl-sn-glycerol-3-phosphate acyltransferase, partial [Candidatus Hydrogenedentes bacterium]|nr:1-acyl-sn-glycerol-3-phosphate acyltransferase [Candidatus Hydrogenedentota bacterium]
VGALARQNIVKFAEDTLQISESHTSYLLAIIAIGMGIGALLAGTLSRGKVELGLVPIGALGMTFFSVLLALPENIHRATTIPVFRAISIPLTGGDNGLAVRLAEATSGHYLVVLVFSLGLGCFAGVYGIPLAAAIQKRAPKKLRGGVIAAVNMLTWVGIAFSSIVFLLLEILGLSTYSVFGFMAVSALAIGLILCILKPSMTLRMIWWILASTIFKLRVANRHNIPEEGSALLIGNHESFVDAMVLQAAIDREIYFVVGSKLLDTPWLRWCARAMYIIPVNERDEEAINKTAVLIREKIAQGHLVCVNRSKKFTHDGCTLPWYQDYKLITGNSQVPVIPVVTNRLWNLFYIFHEGHVQWRFPNKFPIPIYVRCGETVAENTTAYHVRNAVQELDMENYSERDYRYSVLQYGFVSVARRFLWRISIADVMTGKLNFFKTLVGTIVLARKFKPILGKTPMVAILMPPTIGGALANLAVQLMGRVPVNLNYTASNEIIA